MSDRGVGDHAWILECVAIERQDAHEGCLESEKHARLNLCSTRQTAGLRRDHEGVGAEVSEKTRKARGVNVWRHHSVVVAGNRKDRGAIVPLRLIELVVIGMVFTESVNH